MLTLKVINLNEKHAFFNIFQKYLYEMSFYYKDYLINDDGNYEYEYFDDYFLENNRELYYICHNEIKIGFVMINPYSVNNTKIDYSIAEFTIFPNYRQMNFAKNIVSQILKARIGIWQIKFHKQNTAAKNLWLGVTKIYQPKLIELDNEILLEFSVKN